MPRKNGVLRHTLTVIRDAIDMYFANSGGVYPGADGDENTFKADLDPYLAVARPSRVARWDRCRTIPC